MRRVRAVPETICALPWVNLSLDVDGTSRPCCKFAHLTGDSRYQLLNLADHSLAEVWNGDAMQRLRRDFRAGVKPVECSTCWDEEAAGVPSYRQTFAEYRDLGREVDYDSFVVESPAALDLKLTNACNLKCRICSPVASSSWLQEELGRDRSSRRPFIQYLTDNRTFFLSNKITHHPDNLATFRSWLPHLEHIEITGGEPMMSPENRELIRLIVEEGRPEQVGILFNTNATVVDDRILGHLPAFKDVSVCLSIDDVGERFEYERSGATWSTVEDIVGRYTTIANERCRIYAFCSVSVFNVWYLPEYVEWLLGRPDAKRIELALNLVHSPRHFSIQVLPRQVKDAVRQRMSDLASTKHLDKSIARSVRDVIQFLDGSRRGDAAEWVKCRAEIAERDGIRSESFAATFGEFARQLELAGG